MKIEESNNDENNEETINHDIINERIKLNAEDE